MNERMATITKKQYEELMFGINQLNLKIKHQQKIIRSLQKQRNELKSQLRISNELVDQMIYIQEQKCISD